MAPLRIGIDARIVDGTNGGIEQFVIGLASGLSQLTDGEEQYRFLIPAGGGQMVLPYLHGNCQPLSCRPIVKPAPTQRRSPAARMRKSLTRSIEHSCLRRPIVRGVERSRTLRRLVARLGSLLPRSDGVAESAGIDVLHFTNQTAFLTSLPNIYHPHDIQHVHLPQLFSLSEYLAREVIYRTFCERAAAVAVSSSWVKNDLAHRYALPPERVQVVPLAPPTTEFPVPSAGDLAAARGTFSLPGAFVFYPAQTWAHKNHIGLLRALALLRDRHALVVPLCASGVRNDYYPVIEAEVQRLQLSGQVQFIGFVTPLELQCLYRLCRCVVIPTRFEAASFPLWEAYHAGVPTACSHVTSLPQQAGDASLLFDPDQPEAIAEAIARLWTDEALRSTLIARGQHRAARFTWARTALMFRALYRRTAGRALSQADRDLLQPDPLI